MKQFSLLHIVSVLVASLIGGASATLLRGQSSSPTAQQVVRAERFELVDRTGAVRAHLETDPRTGITNLSLFDGNRKPRVWVGASDQPSVILWGPAGEPRLELSLSTDGSPSVELRDASGPQTQSDPLRVAIGAARKSLPNGVFETFPISSVLVFDGTGKIISKLPQ